MRNYAFSPQRLNSMFSGIFSQYYRCRLDDEISKKELILAILWYGKFSKKKFVLFFTNSTILKIFRVGLCNCRSMHQSQKCTSNQFE